MTETMTCPACALLTAEDLEGDEWSCGSCGDTFAHAEGVHDVQYGIYHEFTCHACVALEGARPCDRCGEWAHGVTFAVSSDLNSAQWCAVCRLLPVEG